jgi:TRAP-type C4-dicarboxylate transport system substrate-binding protein
MTSRRLRHLSTCGLVLALLSAMSACTGNTLAGKVGVLGPERVLVLANPSIPGLEVPPAITEFVTAASRRSHGRLRVEVHTGLSDIEEERRVVAEVAAGRTDLGWAEAHTIESMGAASLRPLFLPLLVDSYPLQAALLSRYTTPLLADVPPTTGVTPLALFAGALRFAASTDHPLLTAADWTGRVFWTSAHGQEEAGVRALGATPLVDPRDRQTLIQAGLIDSAETTWRAYPASLRFVAPNVRLWPRIVVLLASPSMLRTLTPQQRGWLDGAGGDAATWTLTHASDADAARLKDACRNGTRAALANPVELAAMRALGQRTLRQALMPAWTGDLAREVERLRQQPGFEPPVDIPDGCQYAPADAMPRTAERRAPLTSQSRSIPIVPGCAAREKS